MLLGELGALEPRCPLLLGQGLRAHVARRAHQASRGPARGRHGAEGGLHPDGAEIPVRSSVADRGRLQRAPSLLAALRHHRGVLREGQVFEGAAGEVLDRAPEEARPRGRGEDEGPRFGVTGERVRAVVDDEAMKIRVAHGVSGGVSSTLMRPNDGAGGPWTSRCTAQHTTASPGSTTNRLTSPPEQ